MDELAWAESKLGAPLREYEVAYEHQGRRTLRLVTANRVAFLKLAPDADREQERLTWLGTRLRAPRVVASMQGRLLTEALPGVDLTHDRFTARPNELVETLARGLQDLHALDSKACPFGAGPSVIHGDACLPNFVVDSSGTIGYVDVGGLGRGAPTVDLSAAVWSLAHNLGPSWGRALLHAYGWDAHDHATVDALCARYEARRVVSA